MESGQRGRAAAAAARRGPSARAPTNRRPAPRARGRRHLRSARRTVRGAPRTCRCPAGAGHQQGAGGVLAARATGAHRGRTGPPHRAMLLAATDSGARAWRALSRSGRGGTARRAPPCRGRASLDHPAVPPFDVVGAERPDEHAVAQHQPLVARRATRTASSRVSSGASVGVCVERASCRRAPGAADRGARPCVRSRSRPCRRRGRASTTGNACAVGAPQVVGRAPPPARCRRAPSAAAAHRVGHRAPASAGRGTRSAGPCARPVAIRMSGDVPEEERHADVAARRTIQTATARSPTPTTMPHVARDPHRGTAVAGEPHTAASSIRPPSSGNPGSAFKRGEDQAELRRAHDDRRTTTPS